MPELGDQNEIDAYYLADAAHARAAGVMWPALVEIRINRLFETGLRPDKTVKNELFQPSGALGNYAVKVRLAYLLGWIQKDFYNDLLLIAKIRNRFAHSIEVKDFDDQKILAWLKSMNAYKVLPQMLEHYKAKLAEGGSAATRAAVFILEQDLQDPIFAFRQCIDQMLHHIDRCAANMKKNLEDLPGNWMVADKPATQSAADNE